MTISIVSAGELWDFQGPEEGGVDAGFKGA